VLRPMSEEAFKDSLVPQIDVALAAGLDTLVFVPGKIGERIALAIGVPQEAAVETSNFIGFMLDSAAERGVKNVVILGHTGKLVKIAAGVFHTHNRVADARLETLAAYAAAEGLSTEGVRTILTSNTTEDAMECIAQDGTDLAMNRYNPHKKKARKQEGSHEAQQEENSSASGE